MVIFAWHRYFLHLFLQFAATLQWFNFFCWCFTSNIRPTEFCVHIKDICLFAKPKIAEQLSHVVLSKIVKERQMNWSQFVSWSNQNYSQWPKQSQDKSRNESFSCADGHLFDLLTFSCFNLSADFNASGQPNSNWQQSVSKYRKSTDPARSNRRKREVNVHHGGGFSSQWSRKRIFLYDGLF